MTTTSTAGPGCGSGTEHRRVCMAQRAFSALFVLIIIFASLSDSFMTGTNLNSLLASLRGLQRPAVAGHA